MEDGQRLGLQLMPKVLHHMEPRAMRRRLMNQTEGKIKQNNTWIETPLQEFNLLQN